MLDIKHLKNIREDNDLSQQEISTINIYKLSKIFNISIDDLIDKTLETQKITEKIWVISYLLLSRVPLVF